MEEERAVAVTGQTLYDCAELPEWKAFVDRYQQHWFDDDERFRHTYAILEDCPETWLDKKGRYKMPIHPSEWVTHGTESLLGLSGHDGEAGKPIERVGAALRDKLHTAEENIRLFLAIRAVLDTAADAVGLDVPGSNGVLAGANTRLGAFVAIYNLPLKELKEEDRCGQSDETRLEKALRMLPAINRDRLKPSDECMKQLKESILDNARGDEWLRTRVRSLRCGDGFKFDDLLD